MSTFYLDQGARKIEEYMLPEIIAEFRKTLNNTHEYILCEAIGRYDVYFPFVDTNRLMLMVDKVSSKGVILNGTVFVGSSNSLGKRFSSDKMVAHQIARQCDVPTLDSRVLVDRKDASDFWDLHSGKCILKPVAGRMGEGVVLNFSSKEQYLDIFDKTSTTRKTIGQQKSEGCVDIRTLFVGGKFVAAVQRKWYTIIGDGQKTFSELVTEQNGIRSEVNTSKRSVMPLLEVNSMNASNRLNVGDTSVIENGRTLILTNPDDLNGESATEITCTVHPWLSSRLVK
jgi:hypothetical protein